MSTLEHPKFVIAGAGLAGSLLAVYLARRGYEVELFERRGDPRIGSGGEGRSINLAISHRGICAMERVGLAKEVLQEAVPMRGRMIHSVDGELTFQRYGKDDTQTINSVSRNGLNRTLIKAALREPTVKVHFDQRCVHADFDKRTADFVNTRTQEQITVSAPILVGADGAFSAVRAQMQRRDRFDYEQTYIEHGYKELTIPAGADGSFRMEKNALHIWPRHSFMTIALPNADGSFTCTLFWPHGGPHGFSVLTDRAEVRAYFDRVFPDVSALIPNLEDDYLGSATGSLLTIRCDPWFIGDRAVLIGDACHAVVPFFGQGANAAFEDVLVLDECLSRHGHDLASAFEEYLRLRKVNTDALAELALTNFIEMRDRTGSRLFLARKKVEHLLHKLFPRWYMPLYIMVTFTRIPYAEAQARAKRQDRIVAATATVIFLLLMFLIVWLLV